MTQKRPTRRRAGWKRRTAVWVVVCAALGLVTTVGVAWFGAWDSHQKDKIFGRFKFWVENRFGDEPGDVFGVWFMQANRLTSSVTVQFSRSRAEMSEQNTHEGQAGSDIDDEDEEMVEDEGTDDSEDDDQSGYSTFELPEIPELHEIPHARERWGELAWGVNPQFTMEELPPYSHDSRDDFKTIARQKVAAGWPRLALWCQRERVNSPNSRTETWRGAWLQERAPYPSGKVSELIIPYLPIWRGLLIDTAFWGAVWFILLWPIGLVAGRLKRARRRAKGKCAWCKYDLRGIESELCPECGGERKTMPRR